MPGLARERGSSVTKLSGPMNPNWKGGRTVTERGYVLVRDPSNPMADVRGYVYEHRLIAAEKLGRPLTPQEHGHHRNERKADNRPENVEALSVAEHRLRHRRPDSNLRLPSEPNPEIHCACGCDGMLLRYDEAGRPRRFLPGHNTRLRPRPASDAMVAALVEGPADIRTLSRRSGIGARAAKTMLSRMVKSGEAVRMTTGVYGPPGTPVSAKPANENPIVACACGCGSTFPKLDPYGRPRKYVSGHNRPVRWRQAA